VGKMRLAAPVLTSCENLIVLTASCPPFEKARRTGHPSVAETSTPKNRGYSAHLKMRSVGGAIFLDCDIIAAHVHLVKTLSEDCAS
jgi:hypothetical protein